MPIGLKINSPAVVEEGETYPITLTVKNTSSKGGETVEAVLGIGISAGTNFVSFIPARVDQESFAAGQTRVLEYLINIPQGTAGQAGGVITAWVEDPTGYVLASAEEDLTIAPSVGTIKSGAIEVLKVFGKDLVNVVGSTAELATPLVLDRPRAVSIKFRTGMAFNSQGVVGIIIYVWHLREDGGPQGPTYRGMKSPPMECWWYHPPPYDNICVSGATGYLGDVWETTISASDIAGGGCWSPGIYNLMVKWDPYWWDGVYHGGAEFTIKNALRCTGSGVVYST